MQKRTLGKLEVSALGLGCMGMSLGYGQFDDKQSIRVIRHAIDKGVTLLDTSDLYGNGHNEILIKEALTGLRDKVILATKCGFVSLGKVDGSPAHIKKACDASLSRLGVDVIDLYYLHRADKSIPIEESVGAFADLVSAGKIRHIGLSEVTVPTLKRAATVHPITALQSEYSLWERKPEQNGVLNACRELGIGFVPYSPLGRGFLSGHYRNTAGLEQNDFRRLLPKFNDACLEHNRQLIDKLVAFAKDKNCTPAQLALAWLLAQHETIVPIPGTRSIDRLNGNLGALDLTLSTVELDEMNQWMQTIGEQYPAEHDLEV